MEITNAQEMLHNVNIYPNLSPGNEQRKRLEVLRNNDHDKFLVAITSS